MDMKLVHHIQIGCFERGENQKGKGNMKKIFRCFGQLIIFAALLASLMGCVAREEPETKPPEEVIPECSVVVKAGYGMATVLDKLGLDYNFANPLLLVNGAVATKSQDLHAGDVVVLAEKPEECNGDYIAARQVSFNLSYGTWRQVSGFQAPVTDQRLLNALQQVCEGVRWEQFGLRFDGDIVNGGCNFPTGIKMSFADGSESCDMYETVSEAYESTRTNLIDVKWIEVASTNTGENLCNR